MRSKLKMTIFQYFIFTSSLLTQLSRALYLDLPTQRDLGEQNSQHVALWRHCLPDLVNESQVWHIPSVATAYRHRCIQFWCLFFLFSSSSTLIALIIREWIDEENQWDFRIAVLLTDWSCGRLKERRNQWPTACGFSTILLGEERQEQSGWWLFLEDMLFALVSVISCIVHCCSAHSLNWTCDVYCSCIWTSISWLYRLCFGNRVGSRPVYSCIM